MKILLPSNSKLARRSLSYLLFALLSVISCQSFSQPYLKAEVQNTNCPVSRHEADIWFFGQNAGIDFRSDLAVPVLNNFEMVALQSCAIISDSTGNMLFFTDGMHVWNRMEGIMPNGGNLHGDPGVTMPAIIIPRPGNNTIYYIFTVDRPKIQPADTNAFGLQLSEVDLSLAGGLGDITSLKNKPLVPEISEKVTAVRHRNGKDVWVVVHRWDSNEFLSFLVTSSGVDSNYISSKVGSIHAGPISTNNMVGFMKLSPDGSKLALAIHGSKKYEIFDFDNSTGQVRNAVTSPAVYSGAYGIEFSPDNKFLYATTAFVGGLPDSTSRLYQFDVTAGGAIFNNPVELAVDTNAQYFCGLQLGTDGRIYVARSPFGFNAAGVIYNPKRPGLACNFNSLSHGPSSFDLGGKRSKYGFPAFIQSYFDLPHFDVEYTCFNDTMVLKLTNPANIDAITWNFGDPTSFDNTSTAIQPTHIFSHPGTFTVSVSEIFNGINYNYSEDVLINELPNIQLADTIYLYKGSTVILSAGDGFTSYEWSTGENTQNIKISQPGKYWVTAQNQKCCFNTDTTMVVYFDVLVPNAFRPDGTNKIFRAVPTSSQAINNFTLYIYNRWGQQIFESKDINAGWDGTINGQVAAGDVYVWIINYYVQKDSGEERVTYKGNVVLLR
jgi:gliding motility-associated-like protein